MATGREMQLTKQIGEYLVCAELCRLKFVATSFTGNVPEFDILAINDKHETNPIQVKAIKSTSWQFDAGKFLDISFDNEHNMQRIERKKPLKNRDLICIFVKLVSQSQDEFYIFRLGDLQEILYRNHTKCLNKYGGKRPRNWKSTHCAVSPESLSRYRNNWKLLTGD